MDDVMAKADSRSVPHPSSSGPVMPAAVAPRQLGRQLTEPVLPFDYRWAPGESVWPCRDCLPWHVEVLLDRHQGSVLLREWHAPGCSVWDLDGGAYEQDQA